MVKGGSTHTLGSGGGGAVASRRLSNATAWNGRHLEQAVAASIGSNTLTPSDRWRSVMLPS